ncbi:hypothetical protein BBJ28_00004625 [Nothophytophthora sp. Chile5]|nr:hypothetical protein BBJ28_00004625 [Nothophytophthora sp. Chile5]
MVPACGTMRLAAESLTALAESAREAERTERELMESEVTPASASSSSRASEASVATEDAAIEDVPSVEGRVFRRLQRFRLWPSELKLQSDMVATYLLAPGVRRRVFVHYRHWWLHHPRHLLKPKAGLGPCVKGHKLLTVITEYLLLSHAANNTPYDAQQLAEGLVLSGFLSPVHEAQEDEGLGTLFVLNDGYYELVAPGAEIVLPTRHAVASVTVSSSLTIAPVGTIVTPMPSTLPPQDRSKSRRRTRDAVSVWSVTDGATRAGFVQRSRRRSRVRNLLNLSPKLQVDYAVVNKVKHHALVLFASDVARQELVYVALPTATVEYYTSTMEGVSYSLKVCGHGEGDGADDTVEILGFASKPEQEQWLLSLLDAGATYLETHPAILSFASSSASLYTLNDVDSRGKVFRLSRLRGHVALLTNVASNLSATDNTQLSELAELAGKYEAAGLRVLAFPTAQFGDAEFDSDAELAGQLQRTVGVPFPVLATRDVNGPNARGAFLFLKTRLPGSATSAAANSFVEGNLVKFLVARDGQPFKRYGPDIAPRSMEKDIQTLLETEATATTSGRRSVLQILLAVVQTVLQVALWSLIA